MNVATNPFAVAALLAVLGLGAMAQTANPPAVEAPAALHQGHHDPARMSEHQARRKAHQAELKQKLQLSAAQEPAWHSFTTAMTPAPRQPPDREALTRMTTPDRIDQMRLLRSARMAEMDRRGDATKAFYATLNADQKKVFDAETANMGRGHRGWHKG